MEDPPAIATMSGNIAISMVENLEYYQNKVIQIPAYTVQIIVTMLHIIVTIFEFSHIGQVNMKYLKFNMISIPFSSLAQ